MRKESSKGCKQSEEPAAGRIRWTVWWVVGGGWWVVSGLHSSFIADKMPRGLFEATHNCGQVKLAYVIAQ
jgi:hypothetical protein